MIYLIYLCTDHLQLLTCRCEKGCVVQDLSIAQIQPTETCPITGDHS